MVCVVERKVQMKKGQLNTEISCSKKCGERDSNNELNKNNPLQK